MEASGPGRQRLQVVGVHNDARGGHSEAVVRPTRESQNTQPSEVRFCATLSQEPVVEVALVWPLTRGGYSVKGTAWEAFSEARDALATRPQYNGGRSP